MNILIMSKNILLTFEVRAELNIYQKCREVLSNDGNGEGRHAAEMVPMLMSIRRAQDKTQLMSNRRIET